MNDIHHNPAGAWRYEELLKIIEFSGSTEKVREIEPV